MDSEQKRIKRYQRKAVRKRGPAQKKVGRPAGVFKDVDTAKLVSDIARGVPTEVACAAVGIHRATFNNWLDSRPEFARALAAEKQRVILEALDGIRSCSTKEREFRNLAWFLERVYPDAFAPKPPNVALGVQQNFTITVEQVRQIEDQRSRLLPEVNRMLGITEGHTNGSEPQT